MSSEHYRAYHTSVRSTHGAHRTGHFQRGQDRLRPGRSSSCVEHVFDHVLNRRILHGQITLNQSVLASPGLLRVRNRSTCMEVTIAAPAGGGGNGSSGGACACEWRAGVADGGSAHGGVSFVTFSAEAWPVRPVLLITLTHPLSKRLMRGDCSKTTVPAWAAGACSLEALTGACVTLSHG